MNWEGIRTWKQGEWDELEKERVHHPECNRPEQDIQEGYSPRLTHQGGRISWLSGQGTFGHQCKTGLSIPMGRGTRKDKAKVLAHAISSMLTDLDDEEARKTLMALSNEELANVIVGGGAQKLQGLRYLGELLNIGVGTPEVDDPESCPVGKGQMDCPTCGGRHQAIELHMKDSLLHSLGQLKQIQANELEGYTPRFKERRNNGA